ncbi:uncharacterized protein TrAtP1_009259 [Trichoderma atroviride]|uniref:Zn(2)-C6 fungal-type domain-containing protein n=1 Tax=Hypocrea atroviridis (strain ATCC 20476 / IMI 206040) TaxID=452589 RepID=G9NEI8_HYPAI|nr:uncharacterized protein TRIATDRAFT_260648 [Trichoderma atroviride IMI 206040]EHK50886.1 hypothetical protein TRIATDRAFT_260648 [Trichoderma atroviride IMI 206040]UKZ68224.1 hypothetical protein TrAtP1_009259 [Trichoderma atroviride]
MGYCGKPSAACERCRHRRMKCDYKTPSCTQCTRAEVRCPGYRSLLDLKFKDQGKEVIRKYRLAAHKKRPIPTTSVELQPSIPCRVPPNSDDSRALCRDKTTLIIPRANPVYPEHEIARSYLYVNYITGGPRGGHMSYLLPLLESSQNSAANAAVSAVALAALSNIRLSPKTMRKAQQEYTAALSKTNLALQDPFMCKTDDTLAAVVMLGTFEIMTCTDGSFIDRWVNHMEGATKLIEVRGSEQLSRREGLELFNQLRAQVSISRIYQERYSSSVFTKLAKDAHLDRNLNYQVLDQLSVVINRLTDFCADMKNGYIVEPTEIIRTALIIDADLVSLMISVPPSWGYATVDVPALDGKPPMRAFWSDTYHIYHSISASSIWNNYRSARIIIQEIIIDTIKDLEALTNIGSPQRSYLANQARQTVLRLVEDICASVPYILGMEIEDSRHLKVSDLGASIAHGVDMRDILPSFQITGAGGLTIMWPLLVAANSGVACDDLRKWVTACLDKIGHSMGINQALAMSKLIRDGVESRAFLSPDYRSQPYKL